MASIAKVNMEDMANELSDWIGVSVDNQTVFVSKEFVSIAYELEQAYSTTQLKQQEAKKKKDKEAKLRSSMVTYAKKYLGNRYVYGGTSLTKGTDCSGFTMRIYEHFGYGIHRQLTHQRLLFLRQSLGIYSSMEVEGL